MNINGLAIMRFNNTETGEEIGVRIKHNTNTDYGKQLVLLKLNPNAVGSFTNPLPAAISTGVVPDKYRILLFALGSSGSAVATDTAQTSLNKLVPLKLKSDATADTSVYFKPFTTDSALIQASNYSVHASASKDDFYWKKIDSFSKESSNAIKYTLQITNADVSSQDPSITTLNIDEFGLYAVATDTDVNGIVTINETLPKILFARLSETYSKSNSIGISIEWIVGIL